MSSVNTIIELGHCLEEDEQDKLKKIFDLLFNISDQEVKIYDAYTYCNQSDFAPIVYEELRQISSHDRKIDSWAE
jgi:hypothetical protein